MYPRLVDGYWEFDGSWPAVGTTAENVIEDFEDGTLDGYGGETGEFSIQNQNVLQGYYSLQGHASFSIIGNDGRNYATPRTDPPTEYRCRMYCMNGGAGTLLVNCQSHTSPYRNCYGMTVDAERNEIRLYKMVNGALESYLERHSMTIDANREYRPYITLGENGTSGGIYDRNGNLLHQMDTYPDTTHSGGGLGWRTAEQGDIIFDYATYHEGELDEVSAAVISNFEDGNLNEWNIPVSSGSQSAEPAAALNGNYGLEMDGYGWVYSLPGDGLNNYIRDGYEFELYFSPRVLGSQQYWIILCPQNDDSTDQSYRLEFLMGSDRMRIMHDSGSSRSTLTGEGTGESNWAEADVTWEEDDWYRAEITVKNSSPYILVDLYNYTDGNWESYVLQDEHSGYIDSTNGIGFYSSGGGRLFVDDIQEI